MPLWEVLSIFENICVWKVLHIKLKMSVIHSPNKYLLSVYYVLGPVLCIGHIRPLLSSELLGSGCKDEVNKRYILHQTV